MGYSSLSWFTIFGLCTVMYGSYGPLVKLSQVDGEVLYDSSQVVFLNELFKLIVNLCFLYWTSSQACRFSLSEAIPYFIPSFCYFFNNNSSIHILSELDPATFSILSNMKIVTTTMLYVLIMKKFPNRLQLSALVILLVASTIHSYGTVVTQSSESDDGSNMRLRVSAYGVSLLIFSISLTSFAAVYTEKTLKKDMTMSLYKQNSYLYMSGMMLNLLTMILRCCYNYMYNNDISTNLTAELFMFRGFNRYTWIIILNTALQGFCVSFIMKYSTNLTRLVLTCASLVVSASMSVILFNLQLNIYFLLSASLVVVALVMYNVASQAPTHHHIQSKQDKEAQP